MFTDLVQQTRAVVGEPGTPEDHHPQCWEKDPNARFTLPCAHDLTCDKAPGLTAAPTVLPQRCQLSTKGRVEGRSRMTGVGFPVGGCVLS